MKKLTLLFVLLAAMAVGARAQAKYFTVEYNDGSKKTFKMDQPALRIDFGPTTKGFWVYDLDERKKLGELSGIKRVRRGIYSFDLNYDQLIDYDAKVYRSTWYEQEGGQARLCVVDEYDQEPVEVIRGGGSWIEWVSGDPSVATVENTGYLGLVKFLREGYVHIYANDEKGHSFSTHYAVLAREFPEGTAIYDDDTRTADYISFNLGDQQYVDLYLGNPDPLSQSSVNWVQWSSSDESVATIEKTPEGIGSQKYIHARATIKSYGTVTFTARSPSGNALLRFLVQVVRTIPVTEEFFPDADFRAYVSENFDTDKNGYLSIIERANVTKIVWTGHGDEDTKTLRGIEYFSELTELYCWDNNLAELDISNNTKLKTLHCYYNKKVETLDVSQVPALSAVVKAGKYRTPISGTRAYYSTELGAELWVDSSTKIITE